MSIDRAMMAVCEVLPPTSVAKPSTNFLSSCAVVDGLKSWLTRMHGSFRWRRLRASLTRSEEHTSELQSPCNLVCRLLLEKQKTLKLAMKLYALLNELALTTLYLASG